MINYPRRQNVKKEYVNIKLCRNNVNIPQYVSALEAAALYRYMVCFERPKAAFLNPKHKVIFSVLENIHDQAGKAFMGVSCLLSDLEDFGLTEKAGGAEYVNKIFGGREPEDYCGWLPLRQKAMPEKQEGVNDKPEPAV